MLNNSVTLNTQIPNNNLLDKISSVQSIFTYILEKFLPDLQQKSYLAPKLIEAMRYSCLNGGKRLRPLLVFLGGELFDANPNNLAQIALSVELVHCYSLIHDDLPAMDNDDLRRGKPTCHKKFDEATAILAGDALQMLAIEILSNSNNFTLKPQSQLNIICELAKATGAQSMVAGQAMDLEAEGKKLDLESLQAIHLAKTGALIKASILCGALASEKVTEQQISALTKYGEAIGLAFQIQDDILDEMGTTQELGKTSGQDSKLAKATYTSILGVEQAKLHATNAYQSAIDSLEIFDNKADLLRELALFIITRKN